jgi:hypothetical protein
MNGVGFGAQFHYNRRHDERPAGHRATVARRNPRELNEARQHEGGVMHGMALASPFDPARIDLCFLADGFEPAVSCRPDN